MTYLCFHFRKFGVLKLTVIFIMVSVIGTRRQLVRNLSVSYHKLPIGNSEKSRKIQTKYQSQVYSMCESWVMAVFLNFSCRHDFWIVAHTLEVELLQNFLSFFGGSKGQLSRWCSENSLRDAKISKIGHFKIFSYYHF